MKTYLRAIIALLFIVLVMYNVRGTSNDFTEAAEGKRASQFDGLIHENAQQMIEGKARCATCHVPPLYNKHLKLNLTEQEKSSLIEYLKSL